jgi:hypothetical protein
MNPLEPARDWTLASNSSALFVDTKSAGNPVSSTDPTADSKALMTSERSVTDVFVMIHRERASHNNPFF